MERPGGDCGFVPSALVPKRYCEMDEDEIRELERLAEEQSDQ